MSLSRLAKTGLFQKISHEEDHETRAIQNELRLHRAVLDKALIDSFSEIKEIREDVENWLDKENQDFIEACERAMLTPGLVFDTFKMMKEILKGDKARFGRVWERNTNDKN